MRVLIACEESQSITIEFRKLGHEAFSCDIIDCSGGHPEWHIKADALKVAYAGGWDLMIAHPPCTYLSLAGNRWFKPEYKDRFPNRLLHRKQALDFFMALYHAPIDHVAIENPIGAICTYFKGADQYIEPCWFGDPARKKTGLWLRGLPHLIPTEVVDPIIYKYKNGKGDSPWHIETLRLPTDERRKVRSKTFKGIARAMATQWGCPQALIGKQLNMWQ